MDDWILYGTCNLIIHLLYLSIGSDEIIIKQLKQMESGLNKVKTELKNLKTPQSSEDKFFARMDVNY